MYQGDHLAYCLRAWFSSCTGAQNYAGLYRLPSRYSDILSSSFLRKINKFLQDP